MNAYLDRPAPLAVLTNAAKAALKLRYTPAVIRSESSAFSIAVRTKAGVVMLGEGAYWVVCFADAEKLAHAGYEYAPFPTSVR